MTMRADMAKTVTEVRKICRGSVAVTDAHWQEAKAAVGDDKGKQESYLKVQAQLGVRDTCKEPCTYGTAASLTYDGDGGATMTAMCNRDPRTRW